MTQPCVFCAIVADEAPASIVYRDEIVIAFMDIRPANPGHVLVVPLEHADSMLDISDEAVMARMFSVGRRVAAALADSGVRLEGFNLFLANGTVAGQTVFHTHLHVLPRFAGDGLGFSRDANARLPSQSDLDEVAKRIRRAGGWE
jgi:histidine triad (HIT) family protein